MANSTLKAVRSLAEEEDKTLTFYDFPPTMTLLHPAPPTPSRTLLSNVGQRTDQIDVFTTEMSCLTIVVEPPSRAFDFQKSRSNRIE